MSALDLTKAVGDGQYPVDFIRLRSYCRFSFSISEEFRLKVLRFRVCVYFRSIQKKRGEKGEGLWPLLQLSLLKTENDEEVNGHDWSTAKIVFVMNLIRLLSFC